MRKKKTAPHSPEHTTISQSQPSGLIAKANTGRESAGAEPALDNRSHRTRGARRGPRKRSGHGPRSGFPILMLKPSWSAAGNESSTAVNIEMSSEPSDSS
jgi:hypothetical protein